MMDMPTQCDCGKLVELDDMRSIGNKLYCEECACELEDMEESV